MSNDITQVLPAEDGETQIARLGQRMLDALVPEARAGFQDPSLVSVLDQCCLTLVIAGVQVSFTIECRCPVGPLNGSGTLEQLENGGISGDGVTVRASSVSADEASGEVDDGVNTGDFMLTPGPCEPMDGEVPDDVDDDDALLCRPPPGEQD